MNDVKELPSLETISKFVETLAPRPHVGPERRRTPRQSVLIPIRICPLNAEFQPIGEVKDALMCNVSSHGAMFVHSRQLDAQFVSMEFPERHPAQQLILEVLRNRPIGSYFEVAGTFVSSDHGAIG